MLRSSHIHKLLILCLFASTPINTSQAQTWGKQTGYSALVEELSAPPPIKHGATTYVPARDKQWHYRKGKSEASFPPDRWRNLEFIEDDSWEIDQTSIGYGDNDDNTVLNDMQGPFENGSEPYTSIYLRKLFFVDPSDVPARLLLKVYVDDGAIVWINGIEVARVHVSEGIKSYNSTAQVHEAEWETIIIGKAQQLLNEGDNIIAIHAFNQNVSSSDFSIDIELTASPFRVSLIEASGRDNNFLPESSPDENPPIGFSFDGSGPFEGQSFRVKTINESVNYEVSGHALEVGKRFFSKDSIVPWVPSIDVYSANQWIYEDFLRTGSSLPPKTEESLVQNHSWISHGYQEDTTPSEVDTIIAIHNEAIRRLDYAIYRDQFIACVGLNNGSNSTVPSILASSYNAIVVGKTNGDHSRGGTVSAIDIGTGAIDHDGPGRIKPDIVANDNSTSACTPQVSSVVTFLLGAAREKGENNAFSPEAMKAIMMAGASKREFKDWSRTRQMPIDTVLGAGKVNAQNSYHILTAGEIEPGRVSANYGWDLGSIDGADEVSYIIELKAGVSEASFSLNWNRIIRSATWLDGNPYSESIPDMSLNLYRKEGNSLTLYDTSDSKVDNFEHLYLRGLRAGQYLVTVSSDMTTDYGLAWRAEPGKVPKPTIVIDPDPDDLTFQFSHLIPGKMFTLEESINLKDWSILHTFIAVQTDGNFSIVIENSELRSFYRLKWSPVN